MSAASRALSPKFLSDLQSGLLAPLRARVARDKSLCLELRGSYINIYYRGGNLMRVSAAVDSYSAFFDVRYFQGVASLMPDARLREEADVAAWLAALPTLKQVMDLNPPGEEREAQQLILRDNNFGNAARSTDYYVCDIEYASPHGRFDLVAVRWPSTSIARKKQVGHRLVLGEVKFGDHALEGSAGLHAHISDVNNHLATPGSLDALKLEMAQVFNQKRALGLIDCDKDLMKFGDEPPLLLLVFVNHDPDKPKLRDLLASAPPSPHAELRVAASSLFGYGLYDPALLTVDEALVRLGA